MKAPQKLAQKLDKARKAWRTLAPDKKFAGMSLDEFEGETKASLDARDDVKVIADRRVDAQMRRTMSDLLTEKLLQLVVNSIKGDPTEGEDSALYKAFGYVPKSERKSGLSRKATRTALPPAHAV